MLFIFGRFDDHEDVEFFCSEVMEKTPIISSLRYVIEDNLENIIVIFDSDSSHEELSTELFLTLKNDSIKFYFLFNRNNMITAHLPVDLKNIIFKPVEKNLPEIKIMNSNLMDLDDVLDKIKKMGIESLSPDEKKFLDNFSI